MKKNTLFLLLLTPHFIKSSEQYISMLQQNISTEKQEELNSVSFNIDSNYNDSSTIEKLHLVADLFEFAVTEARPKIAEFNDGLLARSHTFTHDLLFCATLKNQFEALFENLKSEIKSDSFMDIKMSTYQRTSDYSLLDYKVLLLQKIIYTGEWSKIKRSDEDMLFYLENKSDW